MNSGTKIALAVGGTALVGGGILALALHRQKLRVQIELEGLNADLIEDEDPDAAQRAWEQAVVEGKQAKEDNTVVVTEPAETAEHKRLPYNHVAEVSFPVASGNSLPNKSDWPSGDAARAAILGPYIDATARVWGFDEGFLTFAWAAAYGESRWNLFSTNTTTTEAAAAKRGYDRIVGGQFAIKYGPLAGPPAQYTFGSGGWYMLLPSSVFARSPFRAWYPFDSLFDPAKHMALWSAYLYRNAKIGEAKKGKGNISFLALRRAMRGLAGLYMDDAAPDKWGTKDRLIKHVEAVGGDTAMIYKKYRVARVPDFATLAQEIEDNV